MYLLWYTEKQIPKEDHVLMPETFQYVTLNGKDVFGDVAHLRIWDGELTQAYLRAQVIITGSL